MATPYYRALLKLSGESLKSTGDSAVASTAVSYVAEQIKTVSETGVQLAIVVGGGIAEAGENLFNPLNDLVSEREWQPAGARGDIVPALLGSWAGAYGAVYNSLLPG